MVRVSEGKADLTRRGGAKKAERPERPGQGPAMKRLNRLDCPQKRQILESPSVLKKSR